MYIRPSGNLSDSSLQSFYFSVLFSDSFTVSLDLYTELVRKFKDLPFQEFLNCWIQCFSVVVEIYIKNFFFWIHVFSNKHFPQMLNILQIADSHFLYYFISFLQFLIQIEILTCTHTHFCGYGPSEFRRTKCNRLQLFFAAGEAFIQDVSISKDLFNWNTLI